MGAGRTNFVTCTPASLIVRSLAHELNRRNAPKRALVVQFSRGNAWQKDAPEGRGLAQAGWLLLVGLDAECTNPGYSISYRNLPAPRDSGAGPTPPQSGPA
jgi:hypothetical protein